MTASGNVRSCSLSSHKVLSYGVSLICCTCDLVCCSGVSPATCSGGLCIIRCKLPVPVASFLCIWFRSAVALWLLFFLLCFFCCLLASLCSLILSKLFKPYMLCSFRYKLVTFSIALIPVIWCPVFLILSLCFLWLLWFVVSFANFVIFLTVYRNILQALCFSQSGSVTCCRSKTKPEHKPHLRSGTQPDTTKRNATN